MVVKRILFLIICLISSKWGIGQNGFFDEIHLMDYQRNLQLKDDSSKRIENSFMIRSTTAFQNIQNSFNKNTESILKSLIVGYDYQV